jgi:hypothetical protein
MKFQTHNETEVDTNMSHLQGYITADYEELVDAFGSPMRYGFDDYKVDAEWHISFADGTVASIYNWKNGKKFTKGNPSINGTWSITSVQNSGRIVCFKMLANADTAIIASEQTKAQVEAQCPSLVIKWREHGAAEPATEWLGFNSLVTTKSFSDDGEFVGAGKSSINYRYQYRIRAVAITKDDAKLYGDWIYVPETSISSLVDSSWIYVTRDLRVAAAAPVEEDLT